MSTGTQVVDRVRLRLAPGAGALAGARRFLALCARDVGLDEEHCDEVVQAAAELMAVGGRLRRVLALGVQEHQDRLTVLVDLTGSGAVGMGDAAVALLDELSQDWGWRQLPGCTQAWCEFSVHQQ